MPRSHVLPRAAIIASLVLGAMAAVVPFGVPTSEAQPGPDQWPFLNRTGQVGGATVAIAVEDKTVYAVVGHRLLVIDAVEPSRPGVTGMTAPVVAHRFTHSRDPGHGVGIEHHRGHVYIRGGHRFRLPDDRAKILAFNVVQPSHPTLAGQLGAFAAEIPCLNTYELRVIDDVLFAPACQVVRTIDISDPGDMRAMNLTDEMIAGGFFHLASHGGHVFVFDRSPPWRPERPALRVFDKSDPSDLVEQSSADVSDTWWWALAQLDQTILGYGQDDSLYVVDVSDPLSPVLQARLPLRSNPSAEPIRTNLHALTASSQHAYLTRDSSVNGFEIAVVSLTDPLSPTVVNHILPQGQPWDLMGTNERLYVANGFEHEATDPIYRGVEIFDISDPARPEFTGAITESWSAYDVVTEDAMAYVAAGGGGLRAIDLANPLEPVERGDLSSLGQINDVIKDEQHLYLARGLGNSPGLVAIDVSNPRRPSILAEVPLPAGMSTAVSIARSGNFVYAITHEGVLYTFDVTEPSRPELVDSDALVASREPSMDSFRGVSLAVDDGHLVALLDIPAGYGRLDLLSIAEPSDPERVSSLSLQIADSFGSGSAPSYDVAAEGGRVYATVGDWLVAVDASDVRAPVQRGFVKADVGPVTCIRLNGSSHALGCNPDGFVKFSVADLDSPMEVMQEQLFELGVTPPRWRHNGLAVTESGYIALAHFDQGLLVVRPDSLATPTPTSRATSSHTPTDVPSPLPTASTVASPEASGTPTLTPAMATSVATATPTGTGSATMRSTSTASPNVRVSPEPSATDVVPGARVLYLPISLLERCPPADLFSDVILVVDASTSMFARASDGRMKLEVATDAAQDFLAAMRLQPGGDRAAIVAFNHSSHLLHGLSSNRGPLHAALRQIDVIPGSRLDLGIQAAFEELASASEPRRVRAMVVLSDGFANPVPGVVAVTHARRAQVAGVDVFVVGMGPDMDESVLTAMASSAHHYYPAWDPLLIESIYRELARRVPCPPEAYWGNR